MPSQRNNIGKVFNPNGSKNTRMEIDKSIGALDFRKDELMHIARYQNAAKTIIDEAKKRGRPLKVLDIGCGEMNTARMLYKSFVCKKDDVLAEYFGVDIDFVMAQKAREKYGNVYNKMHAELVVQDLTEEPKLRFADNYFDVVICFEFMEHIKPQFLMNILKECNRVMRADGVALFSTPNSNGSNEKLPKDHIYEYSYEECVQAFQASSFQVEKAVGVCVNVSRLPKEEKQRLEKVYERYAEAFGENSPFMSVAVAPMFNPVYSKNCLYRLRKAR